MLQRFMSLARDPLVSLTRLFRTCCQADASKADQQELLNVEGRLINYLVDCITSGRERDQAYAAVLLARLLTHVRICRAHLAVCFLKGLGRQLDADTNPRHTRRQRQCLRQSVAPDERVRGGLQPAFQMCKRP